MVRSVYLCRNQSFKRFAILALGLGAVWLAETAVVAWSTRPTESQLVQGKRQTFQWGCRGAEPQGKTDYEKSIRFQIDEVPASSAISYTWQLARTLCNPQILLTSLLFIFLPLYNAPPLQSIPSFLYLIYSYFHIHH